MMRWVKRFVRVTAITLNVAAAVMLWLSYASPFVNPADFWLLAIFGVMYPLLIALNLLFLVLWIIRWKWCAIISGVTLIMGLPLLLNFFRFKPPSPPYTGKRDFTMMSLNVNLFRLYAWSKQPPTMDSIEAMVHRLRVDILCLQEFYTDHDHFTEEDARILFGENAHIHYIYPPFNGGIGIATFSRYPIVGGGEIHFEGSANASIFTDVLIGSDTIRVYNNHLQSYRLKRRNLEFIQNSDYRKKANPIHELLDLFTQIRGAVEKRAVQVLQVRAHIDRSPYPVIVCGDFNDSPISFTYKKMRGDLQDAFQEAGDGFGSTYKDIFPSFRIDYALHSASLVALDYTVVPSNYSDHKPILIPFNIRHDE